MESGPKTLVFSSLVHGEDNITLTSKALQSIESVSALHSTVKAPLLSVTIPALHAVQGKES